MTETHLPAKPFLKGSPTDSRTLRAAAGFLGVLLLTCFLNLILSGTAATLHAVWLRVGFCVLQSGVYYALFFYNGQSRGAADIVLGETLYNRQESGRGVSAEERARCFHSLKGFVQALIGSLPALIPAIVYAFLAQRQRMTPGALPGWVSGMASRPDVIAPLTAYTASEPAQLADYLRVVVRVLIMPWVTVAGSQNFDAILTLERLAPALVLLPALFYGTGYLFGTKARARVHESIAEGKKRIERKQAREKRRKQREREPEKLN